MRILGFCCTLLFALEAYVSVMTDEVDLATVVNSSAYIFLVELPDKTTFQKTNFEKENSFRVVGTIRSDSSYRVGSVISIKPAFHALHQDLARSQSSDASRAMPILSRYGNGDPVALSKESRVIVFAVKNSLGDLELTMYGAYDGAKRKAQIEKLMKDR